MGYKVHTHVRFNPWNKSLCIYCTLVYSPHVSNIRGRQYDVEVLNRAFKRSDIIQSISINTSSCSAFIIPMWSISIRVLKRYAYRYPIPFKGISTTSSVVLSRPVMWKQYELQEKHYQAPFWYMVHDKAWRRTTLCHMESMDGSMLPAITCGPRSSNRQSFLNLSLQMESL